ncbi:ATP-binding cassette glutathione S-conjugate transporter YCF1 [Sugiyamaella lignohabitans]|uniref:ATP-binding cassette glutathione S-conjugate transporter YCF1 n=1 Tax=Sugiyamaella lignohabitans TaxID=796027 RepID=A0A161HJQ9_9ASCO|nr:ATP-binding cassette glutathione S-conjugate transporter YCF1 [Sugiyamaella lignohabitans]ANB12997.1 ATP-binding cassette glutathione S-conjugate transporter YCF1 [Sugiyamaella lignohabitans]
MTWLHPLLSKASKDNITERDLPKLDSDFKSAVMSEKLTYYWDRSSRKDAFGLMFAMIKSVKWELIIMIVAELCHNLLGYGQAFVLNRLIRFVAVYGSEDAEPVAVGVYISFLILFVNTASTLLMNVSHMTMVRLMMSVSGCVYGTILRKALKLSPKSRETKTSAQIMNIMTVDIGEIQFCFQIMTTIITAPVQVIICFYSLYSFLGFSFVGGLGVMAIAIPVNAFLSTFLNKYYKAMFEAKDERTKVTSNIFSTAKSLKLYAWENPFLERLSKVRNGKEVGLIRKSKVFNAAFNAIWELVPYLISSAIFTCFLVFQDQPLTAEIVFPSLILFNLLNEPMAIVPLAVATIIQTRVSFERIAGVLAADEYQTEKIHRDLDADVKFDEPAVILENAVVAWNESEDGVVALDDINFTARKGELSCIVGKVGAGKSALLKTICGELYVKEGSVTVKGDIAYVPQEPWLLNQTLKDNILFKNRFDPEFYQKTLEACDLINDIKNLPDGDETEIGEKGVSLSGGQKARVSLARAVYGRSDIYIMDDILSAVDEHVGRHLIDNVLGVNGLLTSKTLILATNNIKVLAEADKITMLEGKKIVESGNLAQVFETKGAIYKLIEEFGSQQEEQDVDVDELQKEVLNDEIQHREHGPQDLLRRASMETLASISDEATKEIKRTAKVEEKLETGKVKTAVYKRYFEAGGYWWSIIAITFLVLTAALETFGSIWLKQWSEKNISGVSGEAIYYLSVYMILGATYTIFNVIGIYLVMCVVGIKAACSIHDKMAKKVLSSPMSFFETTPLGQILNRFTSDVSELDDMISWTLLSFCSMIARLAFAMLIIFFSTPFVLVAAAPLTLLYLYYQRIYLATSRQMKRFSSSARSPMMSQFEESLKGINVIRAYGKDSRFVAENDLRCDLYLQAIYNSQSVDRWLSLRLNFLATLIGFLAALSGVYMTTKGRMTEGLIGLVMSNALSVTTFLSGIVKQTVQIERRGVALERVFQYIDLPSEGPEIIEGKRPAAHWPSEGGIHIRNYSARYRENLDLVLKNINLEIKPREKIGVVGRTGAGKSTLTLSLFRIIEPADGGVIIDGVDTNEIGLLDLRRNLSIIPQDAQIFSGTIRDNLDPFDEHDDTELWRVLELCHLKDHVNSMGNGLESELSDGGDNLSRGQAQLICLGRALLHNSNVLVLDEATASVDVETDSIIQETIRSEFKHKTIITIAHRLNTVMDSDRIAVLDSGEVAEFDTPKALLQDKNSLFYALCEKGGFITEDAKSSSSA